MIRIIVTGACGRMGKAVLSAAFSDPDIEVVGAVEIKGHPSVGKDSKEVSFVGQNGVTISDDLANVIGKGDVLIDFTNANSSMENFTVASREGKPAVIASTGFSDSQFETILKLSQAVPCVLSPNMSVGMNILFKLVEDITRIVEGEYDVEIVEAHHRGKKDSPSGTALRLAEIVSDRRRMKGQDHLIFGRKGLVRERKRGEIGVMAVRAGDIVGDHTVMFGGIGERIEITHRAHSRENFAQGALKAAKWVVNKSDGLFSMKEVLGL